MRNSAIVIPALNPSETLIDYVKELLQKGSSLVIVVNDGSAQELNYIFEQLSAMERCHVLTHEINRGKGRALKTAFEYFLTTETHLKGVVTADSDGQHSVEDIEKIAEALESGERSLILGVRDLNAEHVPFRSTLGNRLTTYFFDWLFGYRLEDTQTGLRGIPASELPTLTQLKGERYEYEINMLIYARRNQLPFHEIPIETIYFNNNEGSHYKSIRDSMKIFRRMLREFFVYKDRKQSEAEL
jgi:glycosyltransferase involved in cell wall biosynthesis